jgi:hypothetical protein
MTKAHGRGDHRQMPLMSASLRAVRDDEPDLHGPEVRPRDLVDDTRWRREKALMREIIGAVGRGRVSGMYLRDLPPLIVAARRFFRGNSSESGHDSSPVNSDSRRVVSPDLP